MIVEIVNSSNSTSETLWLPVYSLNDKLHRSPGFPIVLIVQVLIYLLTAYIIIRTCSIFISIRVFHENMNILMAWFLFQWFEAIAAKLVIIPYQLGLILIDSEASEKTLFSWWTDDRLEMLRIDETADILPLYYACLAQWHYMYSMIFAIVVIGLERVLATFFIEDYESVHRRYIPVSLILITNSITIPYAYLILHNQIPFMVAYTQCFINASLCFFGYFALWRVNLILRNRMARRNDNDTYTLARKFQVEENIRSLILAKKLVIVAVAYLSITLGVLMIVLRGCLHQFETLFVRLLDSSIFSAPLVLGITLLFCSPAWKESFIRQLPFFRHYRNPQVVIQLNYPTKGVEGLESDVYFRQLKIAWN